MATLKVTTELRKSILKFLPNTKFGTVFPDSRMRKTAVGVKFCDLYFSVEDAKKIWTDMESKGFVFIGASIASDKRSNFNGTRFTFRKQTID